MLTEGSQNQVSIEGGPCKVNDEIWGSPCRLEAGRAFITVQDVELQERLINLKDPTSDEPFVVTHFVRCCNFPQSAKDEVDPHTSFVKGLTSFHINIAVRGADSENTVNHTPCWPL
ncbi:unnamed protein product [Taenia asiatica]|uniref:DUF5727 domain-containing protein n=1 Tax=Taenia asiatica TaxID=60517 RepID=A0A0R3WCY9_TAEAS|nr:unnamed protein product [Taenia asiatica]